jgi:hypothetical protein
MSEPVLRQMMGHRRGWLCLRVLLIAPSLAALTHAAAGSTQLHPCAQVAEFTALCGVHAPEDLALLPDGHTLIVSQIRGPGDAAFDPQRSYLAVLDTADGTLRPARMRIDSRPGWGEIACPASSDPIRPGGISLTSAGQRAPELLVINTRANGQSSVEFFEAIQRGGEWILVWHGCAMGASGLMFNSVAPLPQRGFAVTMMAKAELFATPDGIATLLSGRNTGYVLEWTPAGGFKRLADTDGGAPDGILATPDGRFLYYAAWSGRKIVKYDRKLGKPTIEISVDFMPDNFRWAKGGKSFLATGILHSDAVYACVNNAEDCRSTFKAVEVDPRSLSARTLYEAPPGLLGMASVTLPVGADLYIGAATGDRLVRLPQP